MNAFSLGTCSKTTRQFRGGERGGRGGFENLFMSIILDKGKDVRVVGG